MSLEPGVGNVTPILNIETSEQKIRKIETELQKLGIVYCPPEIIDHLLTLEENSSFNLDSRMICEGVKNVLDLMKNAEGSFNLEGVDKERAIKAAYLHDIGKTGPSSDPDCRLAVTKLFTIEGIKNREKVTVKEIVESKFSSEAESMLANLLKAGVKPDMTMLEFHNKHAYWTKELLDKHKKIFDEQTRIIAGSHHLYRNINPYQIDLKNIKEIPNELKFLIFLLMVVDVYQAPIRRERANHIEAMRRVRAVLGGYDDSFFQMVVNNVDQLGGNNSLFPKGMALFEASKVAKK